MESYQNWFGEGPELSVLRMLGLFDRPADEKALGALLKPPAIRGLTESLTGLSPTAWRTILAKLRRARLLSVEDPHHPGHLDTHPLVRQYFGEQLRGEQTDAWKECNKRLYHYYLTLAPQLPDSFREMEPLFVAVICGCRAGLFREALHEVYIPRIQRGDASFAANVLGARAALLLVLIHFFEGGRWGSPLQIDVEGQSLTAEDQLFILVHAGEYLTATRGLGSSEARICYDHAESLCRALFCPLVLFSALEGQWRYSLTTDKLTTSLQIANRVYSLAKEQHEPSLMIGACAALAITHYFSGNFETCGQHAMRGVQIWRSGGVQRPVEEMGVPAVGCLCCEALFKWHIGEITASHLAIEEAMSLAKKLNHAQELVITIHHAAIFAYFERDPVEVERLASDLIELSTRQNFAHWLAVGTIFRGWACSALGDTVKGISLIKDGIEDQRGTGAILGLTCALALKAEALHFADRTSEALEAIREAEALAEEREERWWCAELHRFRGVFLAAVNADETEIEASFCAAIDTAKEQKSVSLEKRAEGTYAEYRRQKASASGGRGFRLPLC